MKKTAFVASPVAAAAVAGAASWFLGGAMPDMAPLYGGAAAAGALAGLLIALPAARTVKDPAPAQIQAAARPRAEEKERVQTVDRPQDVRELREFVASLGRILKTAEEVEAMRSAELEMAAREASSDLAEAARLLDAARQKVAEAGRMLADAQEGGGGGAPAPGGWN